MPRPTKTPTTPKTAKTAKTDIDLVALALAAAVALGAGVVALMQGSLLAAVAGAGAGVIAGVSLPRARWRPAAVLALVALAPALLLVRGAVQAAAGPERPPWEQALQLEAEADGLLFDEDRAADAAGLYARSLEVEPSFPALHKRAVSLLLSGNGAAAGPAFEQALQLAPEGTCRQVYGSGVQELRAGRTDAALAALESAYLASRPEAQEAER